MNLLPVPPPDAITAGWWEATREHRLVVQRCAACARAQHPPRSICIHCGRTDVLRLDDAAGTGVVDSFTVVYRAPAPDLTVPYVIARVRIAEGGVCRHRRTPAAPP
ncbi:MAG: OB-fold domain-containing protein, partial [Micromonosporaceae bacterium]|nr:OB-fold domain-containing protein [Micromonosporaceae bacterium]